MLPAALESALTLLRNSSPTPLDRVVEIMRSTLGCAAGALVASSKGEAFIVSSAGVPMTIAARPFRVEPEYVDAMCRPFEITLEKAMQDRAFRNHPWTSLALPWNYVAVVPVPIKVEGWQFNLLCFDGRDRSGQNLPENMLPAARIISDEITLVSEIATIPPRNECLSVTVDQLSAAIENLPVAAILLDQDLRVMAVNPGLSTNLFFDRDEQIGRPLEAIIQKFGMHDEAVDFVRGQLWSDEPTGTYRGQVFTGGDFELSAIRFDGGNPYKRFVLVFVDSASRPSANSLHDVVRDQKEDLEVTGRFLLDTLIDQRRLINRADISYHALSRWRTPIKEYQITALRLLKQYQPMDFVDRVARRLAISSNSLFGESTIQCVTSVPCGHSGPGCFAGRLGSHIASVLGVEFVKVFDDLQVSGSSHPRKNAARPKITIAQRPPGPVLLIDDVASSGSHICEATRLLRDQSCSVFPLVWIGP